MVRVKGLEAQAAEEELRELQEKYDSTTANVGTSERDLLDQVYELVYLCLGLFDRLTRKLSLSLPSSQFPFSLPIHR